MTPSQVIALDEKVRHTNTIRLATAALSGRIYAGRPNKAGDGFKGERYDVTSDVLKTVAEHIGIDHEATVTVDGKPAYIITIRKA